MRPIESATVSFLHGVASTPWWAWAILIWIGLNVALVARLAYVNREDRKQVVLDVFDGKRSEAVSEWYAARARRDTRAMNAASAELQRVTHRQLRAELGR